MVASAHVPQRHPFALGQIVATPGALAALARANQDAAAFLARHAANDWGDLGRDDWKLNDQAVAHEGDLDRQGRVLSSYKTASHEPLWVVTEADRFSTCVLLPSEY